ncbi:hypothetical protein Y032_0094g2739 [Ancylostoma ceylanicum]|uniref:Uncharacterized protein n=1 Tax=Ancylostoma ceylanicum TaxID=53326 RepID=A0A016TL44_9BILA|nr:hypothetical protein Y032_0094g2739 [Ancylostoma ceylanicum]
MGLFLLVLTAQLLLRFITSRKSFPPPFSFTYFPDPDEQMLKPDEERWREEREKALEEWSEHKRANSAIWRRFQARYQR